MHHALAILAALAASAHAAPADRLAALLASREAVLAALAPSVTVGPIAWNDPACAARFAAAHAVTITIAGADRDALASCVAGLQLAPAKLATGSPVAAIGKAGAVVALGLRNGQLVSIDAVAPAPGEPRLPTVLRWWINRDLTPSAKTRAAIARAPGKLASATFKVCHDDEGRITSRRIVHPSGVTGFDTEALAYLRTVDRLEPYQPGDTPAPACSIFALRYPDVIGGTTAD